MEGWGEWSGGWGERGGGLRACGLRSFMCVADEVYEKGVKYFGGGVFRSWKERVRCNALSDPRALLSSSALVVSFEFLESGTCLSLSTPLPLCFVLRSC